MDADLLVYEALEEAGQLVTGAAATTLAQNRCFNGDQKAQLRLVGRIVADPPAAAAVANPLSSLDMLRIGKTMSGQAALPAPTAAKFSDQVELISKDDAFGFLGSSMLAHGDAFEVIASMVPKRFCCYNGQTPGRWSMGLDIAAEGAAAKPMVADFLTVTQSKIEQIVLRAPTAAERDTMLASWTTAAPARVGGSQTAAP